MLLIIAVTKDYYAIWSGDFVSHRFSTFHSDESNVHLKARNSVLGVTLQDIQFVSGCLLYLFVCCVRHAMHVRLS